MGRLSECLPNGSDSGLFFVSLFGGVDRIPPKVENGGLVGVMPEELIVLRSVVAELFCLRDERVAMLPSVLAALLIIFPKRVLLDLVLPSPT